jgi:hypothetical protein
MILNLFRRGTRQNIGTANIDAGFTLVGLGGVGTVQDASTAFGEPSLDADSLSTVPQLIWPETGATVDYKGPVTQVQWWPPNQVNIQNPSGAAGAPNPPTTGISPWWFTVAGFAVGALLYVNRRALFA